MLKFDWDIHYHCNYNCPYCWFCGQRELKEKLNVYPGTEKLLGYWRTIYEKYGPVQLSIGGGEPFTYPDFIEFVKGCSQMHRIYITSNLSGDTEKFAKEVNPEKVSLAGSFHPTHANLNEFASKVMALRRAGFQVKVTVVAYPPFLKDLQKYSDTFGRGFEIHTFWGNYQGKDYPAAYTEEERKLLEPFVGSRDNSQNKFQLTPKQTNGKLCRAGQLHGTIYANGDVVRCGGEGWKRSQEPFTNIFRDDFSMFKEPIPCRAIACPSNEWAEFLVEEQP